MKKCNSYHITEEKYYTYGTFTGAKTPHYRKVGECWGTRECDRCYCGGDRTKCDFYPEVREKALKPKFGEWISVDDRLPKENEKVLCYFQYQNENLNSICENIYYGNSHWFVEGDHVTHWMPIPKLPKDTTKWKED